MCCGGQPGWTLQFLPVRAGLGWGWTVRAVRPVSSQGALLCLRLCIFPVVAPFPVGCPLRHECNALLLRYSTKLKSWSWKVTCPTNSSAGSELISPGCRRHAAAFPVHPDKALSGTGMLASYGTCSVVSMKVLSVLAVLFPLAGY